MWLAIGLVLGAAIISLVTWLRNHKLKLAWYEWVLGILGLSLLLFAIANYYTSFSENEPTAARNYLLIFGLPALIIVLITFLLSWKRLHRKLA
jgi:uncharacterized membrane protein